MELKTRRNVGGSGTTGLRYRLASRRERTALSNPIFRAMARENTDLGGTRAELPQ